MLDYCKHFRSGFLPLLFQELIACCRPSQVFCYVLSALSIATSACDRVYYRIYVNTHCFLAQRPARGPREDERKSGLLWMFTMWLLSDVHDARTRSGCPGEVGTPVEMVGDGYVSYHHP